MMIGKFAMSIRPFSIEGVTSFLGFFFDSQEFIDYLSYANKNDLLTSISPIVVLLDYRIPTLYGLETAKLVRISNP